MKKKRIIVQTVLICISISLGVVSGMLAEKQKIRIKAENIYHGWAEMSVTISNPNGEKIVSNLRAAGFRFPMGFDEHYVRQVGAFIERKEWDYSSTNMILIGTQGTKECQFAFPNYYQPEDIVIQRWKREEQGTTGRFTNGEIIEFEYDASNKTYTIDRLESGYIYSVYASWGPYYGEFAFLVSDNPKDKTLWKSSEL